MKTQKLNTRLFEKKFEKNQLTAKQMKLLKGGEDNEQNPNPPVIKIKE